MKKRRREEEKKRRRLKNEEEEEKFFLNDLILELTSSICFFSFSKSVARKGNWNSFSIKKENEYVSLHSQSLE